MKTKQIQVDYQTPCSVGIIHKKKKKKTNNLASLSYLPHTHLAIDNKWHTIMQRKQSSFATKATTK